MLTIVALGAAALLITLLAPAVLIQLWLSRGVTAPQRKEPAPVSTRWALGSHG
jgi:hypothetical protein